MNCNFWLTKIDKIKFNYIWIQGNLASTAWNQKGIVRNQCQCLVMRRRSRWLGDPRRRRTDGLRERDKEWVLEFRLSLLQWLRLLDLLPWLNQNTKVPGCSSWDGTHLCYDTRLTDKAIGRNLNKFIYFREVQISQKGWTYKKRHSKLQFLNIKPTPKQTLTPT